MPKSCCPPKESSCHKESRRLDVLLWGSLFVIGLAYLMWFINPPFLMWDHRVAHFTHGIADLVNQMWWGMLIGILAVGVLGKVPREFVMATLGRNGHWTGLVRATLAGVLFDLCSHGILLIGTKLYERGASIGQVMAFLIASPWNSFSLLILLFVLIGVKWTLVFLVLSVLIALVTGYYFEYLVKQGVLPANPNRVELPKDFHFFYEAKRGLGQVKWNSHFFVSLMKEGFQGSAMVLRWLFFGIVLAALVRGLISTEAFQTYFGATLAGLGMTLIAATVIEVCSEGSLPIAADLMTRAKAPGNSFTFLMAGVSTDYTEIMAIKETTASWRIALFLPLISLPQIVIFALLLNSFSVS